MKIYEINAELGTEIVRDATAEETAEIEATQADAQQAKSNRVAQEENAAELKESAINKLIDLGLSEAEAKAFLG